jgi:hypothetical protein
MFVIIKFSDIHFSVVIKVPKLTASLMSFFLFRFISLVFIAWLSEACCFAEGKNSSTE